MVTRPLRFAEILAVGSELLTPFRSDTNSLYLTARLNELGLEVRAKSVLPDNRAVVGDAVRVALARADVVVTTGGLGPTDDDVTREAVADAAGVVCEEDPALVAAIAERFARRGIRMPSINARQGQVPTGAVALANPNGTAPGLWFEIGEGVLIALPGPPRELKPMFETDVLPRLRARCAGGVLRRRTLKIAGRGESQVEEIAQPIYTTWLESDPVINTTILAAAGQVELHLSAQGRDADRLDRALGVAAQRLHDALGHAVFSVDGRSLAEVVGRLLLDGHLSLSAAESCTAGLLLGALTDVSGSSAWITGGVVAYSNEVKVQELGVPAELIAARGAVSEPVAQAMADGVRRRLKTDIGVGVTGIAGPTGGTPSKPVGTVAIAVAGPAERMVVRTVRLPGDRTTVRQMAVQAALDMIRRVLTDADYN